MSTPPLSSKDADRASTRVRGVTFAAMIATVIVLVLFAMFRLLADRSETVALAIIAMIAIWPVAAVLATMAFVKPGPNRLIGLICGLGLLIPIGSLAFGIITTMGL